MNDASDVKVFWRTGLLILTASAIAAMPVIGLAQAGSPPQPRAQQIPLSGREQGSVSAQQRANPGGGVSTIQSAVVVTGRYQGSATDSSVTPALALSGEQAIQRGLQFNLGASTATNSESVSRAQRLAALSALLPNLNGNLSETVQQTYLPSAGITGSTLGLPTSTSVPAVTGQFHYYTAQASASWDAFDLTAVHNIRSAQALEAASHMSTRDAHELVVLAVGGTYLQALADAAVVESQKKQVASSEASYRQAEAQKNAGTRAYIDANRSLVEFRTEQQRLATDEAELAKQLISLARMIGVAPGTQVTLTDHLPEAIATPVALEDEIARAEAQRFDLKAAEANVKAAEEAAKAARSEYLPTANVSGSYGLQGTSFDTGRASYSGVASLNIPIFQSGRVRADTKQANTTVAQRRSELADQRAAVEAEVRIAMIDLEVAAKQTAVAKENEALAGDTLRQSQDRFAAGVTDSVEVVQSQESLAAANHDYIGSLYSKSLARLRLAQATGTAEQEFHSLLGAGGKQ